MSGDIKLQGLGSDIKESVDGWVTSAQRRKDSDERDPEAEVDVTRAPNERFGSSRSMLTGMGEIVAAVDNLRR